MKAIAIVAAVMLAWGTAAAFEGPKNYVTIQAISSQSECRGFQEGVAPLGLTATCDTRDTGFRVAYGRYLTSIFGLELGYQDAGAGHANGIAPNGAVVVQLTAPLKAVDLVATARYAFAPNFLVVARAGGARWNYEVNTTAPGFGAKQTKVTPTYGIGLEYRWFTLGFDVIHHVGQENLLAPTAPRIIQDVKRISGGLKYAF